MQKKSARKIMVTQDPERRIKVVDNTPTPIREIDPRTGMVKVKSDGL